VAAQLTRKRIMAHLSDDAPVIMVPGPYLLALAALCVVLVYASLFAAMYTARRNERASERLYSDTLTLTQAPAPDLKGLQGELDAAKAGLASAEQLAAPSDIDPSSDETTALLVRRAQTAGLEVTGINRLDPSQAKTETATYGVQAIRMTVRGGVAQINDFLYQLYEADPALISTLTSLTSGRDGSAEAEVVFSVYTKAEPAPAPGAPKR